MAAFPIVAIGSSAGGLEALEALFRAVPAESGAAFVVVAHLDPTHVSHLPELLGRCTPMPVRQIEQEVRLEPNQVQVIGPDQELSIEEGVVRPAEPTAPRGHRHPVDSFFRSLAADQGDRAIAVILSGTGSNGSLGLRFVKAEGGIVIAQDPETAGFAGMPQNAIRTGLVDLVLPPEQIGEALVEFFRHPHLREPEKVAAGRSAEEALKSLLALVQARTRKDFSCYRKNTLNRRIGRRMGLRRIESLDDYIELLKDDQHELSSLLADLTINVTGFFRDPEAWQTLARQVIAPLVRERSAGSSIRAWVAGCSTGEEAYSLAMLLAEEVAEQRKDLDLRLFATDVAAGVLAAARAGIYPSSIDQDVSAERLERFFDAQDDTYRVKRQVRETITFAPQDLLQDPPFSQLDLVVCRNLLIYLQPATQKRALALFHFVLEADGYLFLGSAESVSGREELFEPVSKRWRIYRRIGPTRHDIVDIPLVGHRGYGRRGNEQPATSPAAHRSRPGEIADRMLLERFAPASVLIDERFQILHFRGPTGDYLQPPSGEPTHDLISMAREGLPTALRAVVRQALDQHRETSAEARVRRDGRFEPVRITAAPLRPEAGEHRLLVTFVDHREQSQPRALEPSPEAGEDKLLQAELDDVREELRLTVHQRETSNEELQASNEEIRSINEELQASNEELETSKEELQSLNEELNTVNNQLEAKLVELEERTSRLDNLLNSTDVATLFLDRALCVRWFTPGIKQLLELRHSDVGRPAANFAQHFTDGDMLAEARQVLDTLQPTATEVLRDDGRWFMRRILPYRTMQERIDGVVVTFVDITDHKKEIEARMRSEERLQRVLETEAVGIVFFDQEGRVIDANDVFLGISGLGRAEVRGGEIHWRDLTPPEHVEATEAQLRRLRETGRLGPYEKEYFRGDGSRIWLMCTGRDLGDGTFVEYTIDIAERKRAEAERELLTRELGHRVKNTLGVIQAIASQTDGEVDSVDEYKSKFLGRLRALGRAHGLLTKNQWQSTDLAELVEVELAPYRSPAGQAVQIDGEPLEISVTQALGLSLVLHELGTNAAKHGALSVPGGRVSVSWIIEGARGRRRVRLTWRESDGPPVAPPQRQGFGTRLIERALAHDIGAETKLHFLPPGLVCEIVFPLEQ